MVEPLRTPEEIGHHLLGTCHILELVTTEEEREQPGFHERLDATVFLCEQCGWWDEAGTQDDDWRCEECHDADEDD